MIEWFMCLYCRTLPWPTVLRIWDMFLCEGILYEYSCDIMKSFRHQSYLPCSSCNSSRNLWNECPGSPSFFLRLFICSANSQASDDEIKAHLCLHRNTLNVLNFWFKWISMMLPFNSDSLVQEVQWSLCYSHSIEESSIGISWGRSTHEEGILFLLFFLVVYCLHCIWNPMKTVHNTGFTLIRKVSFMNQTTKIDSPIAWFPFHWRWSIFDWTMEKWKDFTSEHSN